MIMKKNRRTRLNGGKVVLVPYRKLHVPKYHDWMKSLELQELTASEPLSLQEEFQMQEKWAVDEDKCTFIVLDASTFNSSKDEVESMIGDTNLFFNDPENRHTAEVEIMIAEHRNRGRGAGKEALSLMLRYGVEELNVREYTAKIGITNTTSLKLFSSIGFAEVSRSEVFHEVTLKCDVTSVWVETLRSLSEAYVIETEQQDEENR